jgi:hypothetical protein
MSQQIKEIDNMFAEADEAKQSIVDAHEKKKVEDQEKMIKSFKEHLSLTRTPQAQNNKKDFNKIFKDAREYCVKLLTDCTCMPLEEICKVFSTEDFTIDPCHPSGKVNPKYGSYYWFNFLKRENNLIPLPYEMEKPKRKDKRTGKIVDLDFTVSRFYTDKEFLDMCNEHFNKFNLNFYVTNVPRQDGKNSFKWKLELVINESGFINLNPEMKQTDQLDLEEVEE